MLQFIDLHAQFDRDEATPFLLLDGHGSRFELEFLDYINDVNHKWTVSIGVPYRTSFWLVGDSAEQNGSFKIQLKKAKEAVLEQKAKLHLPYKVEKEDIIGIIHRAWKNSFAKVESNKKAIADRGWYPKNFMLLDNEELRKEKNNKHVLLYSQSYVIDY
jgi:hypothetical protein